MPGLNDAQCPRLGSSRAIVPQDHQDIQMERKTKEKEIHKLIVEERLLRQIGR